MPVTPVTSESSGEKQLRWFVGVPLGTNPLILLDFGTLLIIAWGVSWVALLLLQFVMGGGIELAHLRDAAAVASYLTVVFTGLYLLICFIIMRNHYAALYRFDGSGIFCENMRCHPKPLHRALIRFQPFEIEPQQTSIRSVERTLSWHEVTRIQLLTELHVLVLKGKRGTLMRVYCPNDAIFTEALAFVKERTQIQSASS